MPGCLNGEVLVGPQAVFLGLGHHFIEELLAHPVLQQPLAVLGEHRGVEAALMRFMFRNQRNSLDSSG